MIVDAIFADPCVGTEGGEVGPSVNDLAMALLDQPFTETSEPIDTMLGGLPAKRVDLTVPDDFGTAACNVPGGFQVWYSQPADNHMVALADGTASVYVLDVNGERQVFDTQHRTETTADDISEMQEMVESIKIDS